MEETIQSEPVETEIASSSTDSDLDNLLAEYDAGTKEAIERSASNHPIGSLDELFSDKHSALREQAAYSSRIAEDAKQQIEALTGLQQQIAQQEFQKKNNADLSELVKAVRGEVDSERFPDDVVQAWIDAKARTNEQWQTAWLQRSENPTAWQRVEHQLCREFSNSALKAIDPGLTEDRAIVAAAVRGASVNRAPESPPPHYGRQSSHDFRQSVFDQFGFDPLG